jgi:thiamine-monophosphate kinase
MSLGEFDLIKRYFTQVAITSNNIGVSIGIGDDCAILDIPEGYQLAVTTDSLVSGVHFFEDVSAYRLGYKTLAVNLSDLAAMGATPKWVSLAITLPNVDEEWLSEFSRGFFELANKHNISLIGGDTTKGPLSITVSAKGIVPRDKALLRSGAKAGDLICVSGVLGDAALGLASKLEQIYLTDIDSFVDALELTDPRNDLGVSLSGYGSSCIDISDGLLQDLGHISKASQCSAIIQLEKLPLSIAMLKEIKSNTLSIDQALQYALTGGDDYELLFTINKKHYEKLILQLTLLDKPTPVSVIGEIVEGNNPKIQIRKNTKIVSTKFAGWDHFKQNKPSLSGKKLNET